MSRIADPGCSPTQATTLEIRAACATLHVQVVLDGL
jgi:hypothetical protein